MFDSIRFSISAFLINAALKILPEAYHISTKKGDVVERVGLTGNDFGNFGERNIFTCECPKCQWSPVPGTQIYLRFGEMLRCQECGTPLKCNYKGQGNGIQ